MILLEREAMTLHVQHTARGGVMFVAVNILEGSE